MRRWIIGGQNITFVEQGTREEDIRDGCLACGRAAGIAGPDKSFAVGKIPQKPAGGLVCHNSFF
jgi:hypothetical protein